MRKKIQEKATLHEKTVQKVAEQNLKVKQVRTRVRKHQANTRVHVYQWNKGVDPLVVKTVRTMGVKPQQVEKVSATEVIVHNPGVKWRK